MMEAVSARHRWHERAGFTIERPIGIELYTFLHFFNSVELEIGGERMVTRPHACILYRYGTRQYFRSPDVLTHDWLHLRQSAEADITRYGVPTDCVFYPSDTSFITAGVCEIELELIGNRPHGGELADAAARMLLIRLGRAQTDADRAPGLPANVRKMLFDFRAELLTHLDEPWTSTRMAHMLNMSVPRLYELYRAQFGVPPTEDLIRARIDAAKNALTSNGCAVTELANRLGYNNPSHFSRQFRQRTGISPRNFARKYQADAENACNSSETVLK